MFRVNLSSPNNKSVGLARFGWLKNYFTINTLFSYPIWFNKNDEFEVQFELIKVFSSVDIEKKFFIQEFLDSYPSVISHQRINNIKRCFIQLVKLLEEHDLIESKY